MSFQFDPDKLWGLVEFLPDKLKATKVEALLPEQLAKAAKVLKLFSGADLAPLLDKASVMRQYGQTLGEALSNETFKRDVTSLLRGETVQSPSGQQYLMTGHTCVYCGKPQQVLVPVSG